LDVIIIKYINNLDYYNINYNIIIIYTVNINILHKMYLTETYISILYEKILFLYL